MADTIKPSSTAELADALKELNARKQVVVPQGGGSHQHVGAAAPEGAAILDLTGLRGAEFYEPEDMVACYRAGSSLALMQNDLRKQGQRLECDPAHPPATIGGCLSVDHFGPRSHAWGSLRDKVLGMTYVLPDGRIIKAGGRTMKNVAGYDLSRLMVGSLGTLGVIADVTVRLNPIGEMSRVWIASYSSVRDAWTAANRVANSQLEPQAVCLMDYEAVNKVCDAAPDGEALVLVAAEGLEEQVIYHEQQLPTVLGRTPDLTLTGDACTSLWERWPQSLKDVGLTPFMLRCGCRAGHFPRLLNALYQNYGYYAYVGRGNLFLPISTIQGLEDARALFEAIGGYATVWRSSRELNPDQIWGRPRGDFAIMRRLKDLHDPNAILNPGRFYGGI